MNRLTPSLAIAVLALASAPAMAADKDGIFSVRGLGSGKCSELTLAIEKKDSASIQLYGSWLSGYLSASNRLISQTFDAIPGSSVNDALGVVAVVCGRNPDVLVETATYQALEALNPVRLRQDSPLLTMQDGARSLKIRQEALMFVQTELASAKLYKGPADGKPSPELARSIRTFQKAQKLPETGLPDMDVIVRLKFSSVKK
jgi:hypothetical protein